MATLDIFNADPFSAVEMTTAIEKAPFKPQLLGQLNIFTPRPIRTRAAMVEERSGSLSLVATSPRGTPAPQRSNEARKVRYFDVPRIAQSDTLYADELQNIRAFGTESELMQVQAEVARRQTGPTGLLSQIEYTWENMRLGAISGIVLDANGSDVIQNWFTGFDISQPAEIDFDLDNASPAAGALRKKCTEVVRGMSRASGGAFMPDTEIYAMCGDAFWDDLINHADVRETYLHWAAAEDLRKGQAFETFAFGGIRWFNYRGSDDASTVGVHTDKAKFFPVKAPGVFEVAFAPAETFDFVNTPGKPYYVIPVVDKDRNMWWRQEIYSYPLFMCTRPGVLYRARRT